VSALLFSGAFFVVVAVLGVRRLRAARQARADATALHFVADHHAVDDVVDAARCACGRRLTRVGEGPRGDGRWGVTLECTCGRRRDLAFVVGH
jgi:hypothetical protein